MSNFIKIESISADPINTTISHDDGTALTGVYSCDICLRPGQINRATLGIYVSKISIEAEPLLSFDTVNDAAEFYGFKLVPEKGKI